jgi:uncharacterized protein (DUF1697 family)
MRLDDGGSLRSALASLETGKKPSDHIETPDYFTGNIIRRSKKVKKLTGQVLNEISSRYPQHCVELVFSASEYDIPCPMKYVTWVLNKLPNKVNTLFMPQTLIRENLGLLIEALTTAMH